MKNSVSKRKQIYEGKAKILLEGPDSGTLIQHFKDDVTAFNNLKKGKIIGKGVINNRISEFIMSRISAIGIPTHFIRSLNMKEQLIKKVEIIPVEVLVRNVAAGSLCKRLGLVEGIVLPRPIIEFCYKNDALSDPFVNEDHIVTFGWSDLQELDEIKIYAMRINDFLTGLFSGVGIRLIDLKLEFGRLISHDNIQWLLTQEDIDPYLRKALKV